MVGMATGSGGFLFSDLAPNTTGDRPLSQSPSQKDTFTGSDNLFVFLGPESYLKVA
mgnify:CR=1 FL=1